MHAAAEPLDLASEAPATPGALPRAEARLLPLCAVARLHRVAADPGLLVHQLGWSPNREVGIADLLLAARHLGLKARHHSTSLDRLALAPLPALAVLRCPSGGTRLVVLAQCDGQRVLFQDPSGELHGGRPVIEPATEFEAAWTGELILITSRASLAGELARFDFSWFVPSLVRHRRLLAEVLGMSVLLQLFALVSPLFFQVVMDKVLVHQGTSTLDVLVTGLVIVVVFESVLGMLRSYVFGHTTSRVDVELGARLFRHLVRLPLPYFLVRRVGDSVARVQELEHIRSFLTGQSLTLLLDAAFSVVFVAVMFVYSVPLTLIVLASLPLYVAVSLAVVPVLRARLNERFARAAESQALLVETISGIQTVKASALEPALTQRWDDQLAAYVLASFRTQTLAAWAHEAIALIGKLAGAALLWFGARQVMAQELTVGQFVAFSLFAQRVAQPILRIAQTWTDFQQTGISMARLGDVLNTPAEVAPAASAQLPALQGRIRFDRVTFRYRPEAPAVLHELTLDISPGEVIGIVGPSGSGKSTLAKLLQRLFVPESGRVLVDGVDIGLVDASQLRRQVGVVLQDNLLFNRSVRENIAITDPGAPLEAVIQAARLAGAHEFITALPEGYDTVVSEQGASLSGGQRQRIAIARALFGNPRILILDEATSALDYESEAALHRNMGAICRGRTVIVIAHRLSAVRHADRIVSLDGGRVVEQGSHEELLRRSDGLYARLWALQSAHTGRASGEAA
jgi:subfamily B ATP-binding cassette protein HlyB/CyaB